MQAPFGSMQSYLRPTDAEAPSGHTQAGLRPGNVQEPLASRAVPHARLEVVASPRHGNPARSHTCTTRTPQTPPVYTGKHSQHAQTTAQDTSRPKKRAAPLKNGKHAAPKPPARAARCRLVARARHAPGHGPKGAMSRLLGGALLQVRRCGRRSRAGGELTAHRTNAPWGLF
jgi:hypothetical protein